MLDNGYAVARKPSQAHRRESSFAQMKRSWRRVEKWFCNADSGMGKWLITA